MKGIDLQQTGILHNWKKTFQKQEFNEDLGVDYYEYKYRYHDPQTGRFLQIDPLAEDYPYNSTYAFSENKLTGHVELEGLESVSFSDVWNNKATLADYIGSGSIIMDVARVVNENLNPIYSLNKGLYELRTGKDFDTGDPKSKASAFSEMGVNVMSSVLDMKALTTVKGVTAAEKTVVEGEAKGVKIDKAYERPKNATTKAQRESVQGKACVDCGEKANKMVADHKKPLVEEYYETGKIDKKNMHSKDAVQPQCPTCSAKQGAELRKYSIEQKKKHGLE